MSDSTVFISYAREDIEAARRLYNDLEDAGVKPWLDQENLLPGQRWKVGIKEAIRTSRYLITLISKHSTTGRGSVQSELKQALEVQKEFPETDIFLIPARLDHSETSNEELRGLVWADMFPSWEHGLARILRAMGVDQQQPEEDERESRSRSKSEEWIVKRRPDDIVVRMHPGNSLTIVVQKDNLETPWFNLDCSLINESRKPGRVQQLEATVTPPGKRDILFMWNVFYKVLPGGRVHQKTAGVGPLELGPEESRSIGVQFAGPRVDWGFLWSDGEYEFDILGWVNRGPRELEADLRTKFRVEISHMDVGQLNRWAQAPDSAWEQLNDPDNAVGIPVIIDGSTLVMG